MSAAGRGAQYREGGAYYTPPRLARAMIAPYAAEFRAYGPGGVPHPSRRLRTLDPSVGGGAFPLALLHHGLVSAGSLEVMDVDPRARGLQLPLGAHATVPAPSTGPCTWSGCDLHDCPVHAGFITTDPQQTPDLIATNPPFGVPRPPAPCSRCDGTGRVTVTSRHTALQRQGHKVGDLVACDKCGGTGQRTFKRAIPVAELHTRRALDVSARWVLLLMRLSMLEAVERLDLWRDCPLREVGIVVPRPDYTAVCRDCAGTGHGRAAPGSHVVPPCSSCNGTGRDPAAQGGDSAAYAGFLFDHQYTDEATIRHIHWRE